MFALAVLLLAVFLLNGLENVVHQDESLLFRC